MSALLATAAVAARSGLVVDVVMPSGPRRRSVFDQLVDVITTGETSRVFRAVGREDIGLRNGGRIRFVDHIAHRLAAGDVVLIDNGQD